MSKTPGNNKYVKKINRMSVLNIVKEREPVSRQQLSEYTGLTPAAITGIVRELLDLGFITEIGLGESHGGRRPLQLKFNCRAGYVIGVEVTRHETSFGIADLKNDPMSMQVKAIDMTEPESGLRELVEAIRGIIDDPVNIDKTFLSLGIAFPGLIDGRGGIVKRSVNLSHRWDNFLLKAFLEEKLGLPVCVENNSKASVLAERWFGGGIKYRDLAYINLGEGISAGIIVDDKILNGYQGYTGQIGHIVMQEGGTLCNCGNRGCLESICGIPALLRKVKSEMPLIGSDDPLTICFREKGIITIEDIMRAAEVEGSYSQKLLRQFGVYVGLAVANVVNFYNPQTVFLGGKLASGWTVFIDILQETVKSHSFPELAHDTKIIAGAFGAYSGVIGSCALALQELLKSPDSDILATVALSTSKTM
ncbi:ROK family protein [Pelosinus sp. sgz500959]|uniref:ROK family transcriptional regulator n=1 Tax=Pelosinus sp. sgz500959 TaxID=3242472 RepID=UPI00366DCBB7